MTNKRLEQIDQELIKLLGERISILSKSKPFSPEEQLSHGKSLLAQTDIPEFVWENLVTSCTAAVSITSKDSSLITHVTPRQITIIGGRGMIGQFFTQQLLLAGHNVSILERDDWKQASNLLGNAELVLICVPIERTIDVIREAAKYLAPTTILADVTSIKTPIVQAMLEAHTGPILGLHPMFGPGVTSFLSQKIVVCPARGDEAFQWFLELIASKGGTLITCTPEEHDQMMIAVQALRHFSTFCLGVFLMEEQINVSRSLEFASPVYRLGIDMVSRLFAQDSSLYIDIMIATEDRRQAIERLGKTFQKLAQLVIQKDQETLSRIFEETKTILGEETTRSLKESNYLINALSILLAANKVE